MPRIPFIGPTGALTSLKASATESVNVYPEVIETSADRTKTVAIMRKRPGLHSLYDFGASNVRGIWSGGGRLFVVAKNTLHEMELVGGTPPALQPIAGRSFLLPTLQTADPVQMFGNGNQLGIVANGYFHYDNGAGPVKATFATGGDVTAVTGAYLDSAAYVQRPAGGSPDLGRRVNFSAPNDFTSWDALDFREKAVGPDYIQSILADREQLYVFGVETSEVWQNDPNSGLPQRIPGSAVREGCVARYSPCSLSSSVFFLGGSPRGQTIAYRLRGFIPERVSTPAVENAWASVGAFASEATSYSYINSTGHQWWVVNFNDGLNTWVYDVTESEKFGEPMWHQWGLWSTAPPATFVSMPTWFHTFIPEWEQGMHIGGGLNTGVLYQMSDAFYDDNGADMAWRRAIPYRYNGGKRTYFGRMTLEHAGGTVKRDYSDDSGATWSAQVDGMGSGRTYWQPTGSSLARVWRFFGKGQTAETLIDLQSEDTEGTV